MCDAPHNLNKLTEKYISLLDSSSYTSNSATWESFQPVLESLNEESTPIEGKILLFNVARLILGETLSISSIKDNKIYGWMTMLYAVETDPHITNLETLVETLASSSDL